MSPDSSLINDRLYDENKSKSVCLSKSLQGIIIILVLGLIAWLSVVTAYLVQQSNTTDNTGNANSIMSTTISLSISSQACAHNGEIKVGTPVSYNSADGKIVTGAGTTVSVGVQHHDYGDEYFPGQLNVISLQHNLVLFGLGSYVIVGDGGDDWATGASFPFNVSADAPALPGWGQFYELPLFPDEIVLLSINNNIALLVGTCGDGVFALRVDVLHKTMTFGNSTAFVSGQSLDTDTAAIGPSSFAISYFYNAPGNTVQLMTIAGYVSSSLEVKFGAPVNYSPDHMFHQILALDTNLYALAFPTDNTTDSTAYPMGFLIASVDSNNAITIWSADGKGAPWLQSHVLGYNYFDMIVVDRMVEADGLTVVGAMAVVDRAAADAITIATFKVVASGDIYEGWSAISCVFGTQLAVTPPGATFGFNYFAMQPLFSLPATASNTHQRRSLKGSGSFTSASAKNDFVIAWQDTSLQGAVEAVIVSYAVESGRLRQVMEITEIAPPVPSQYPFHWWIAGGTLPDGRMMILTTLASSGNLTLVEHRGEVVGLVASTTPCNASSVSVSVNGYVNMNTSMMHQGTVSGPTVWATSRGLLIAGTSAVGNTSQGVYEVIVAEDGCVGLIDSVDGGVWIAPDMC